MSPVSPSPAQRRRAIAAGTIGNVVEWFDFIVYGALAINLAPLFFPSGNQTTSLLATFGAFAAALLFRPLGGFLFGIFGDRAGRRAALSASVLLMSLSTMAIGLLPTSGTIGIWAAVLLVACRCVQGIAVGCEWSGSAVYLVEYGGARPRALFASLTPAGSYLGAMLGVAVVTVFNQTLGAAAIQSWAWRLPFLIAAPLGLVGLYLRTKLEDTPDFQEVKATEAVERAPLRRAFREHRKDMAVIFAGAIASGAAGYFLVGYLLTHLTAVLGVPRGTALLTNTIALGFTVAATVGTGWLADRFGRKPVYLTLLVALTVLAVPAFLLLEARSALWLIVGQSVFGMLAGSIQAPLAVLCVELFPANVRYAASGTSYSLGTGLLGGASPLIATALVSASGWALAPAAYLTLVLVVALALTVPFLTETARRTGVSASAGTAGPAKVAAKPARR